MGLEPTTSSLGIKITAPLFQHLSLRPRVRSKKERNDERSWERSAAEPFESCTPTDRGERAVACRS